MGRITRALAVVVALCAFGVAAVVAAAPDAVPPAVGAALGGLGAQGVLLVVGGLASLYALATAFAWRSPNTGSLGPRNVEDADRDAAVAGATLTTAVEQRAAASSLTAVDETVASRELRAVLVDALERDAPDRAAARETVDRGAWTDDRYAAAFLTDTPAIDYPLTHRLYAWLYPGAAHEKRVRRALRAVEAVCESRYSGYEAPARERSRVARLKAALPTGREAEP